MMRASHFWGDNETVEKLKSEFNEQDGAENLKVKEVRGTKVSEVSWIMQFPEADNMSWNF